MTPTAPEVTRLNHSDWWREHPHGLDGSWELWVDLVALRQMVEEHEANAELIQWAAQNPEAWETLRTGRAQVVRGRLHPRRIDVPFKSEVKEGV